MISDSRTIYEVWQHTVTNERWLIRLEYEALTGVYGPLPSGPIPTEPEMLDFEDHPDDLEWIVRSAHCFTIVRR